MNTHALKMAAVLLASASATITSAPTAGEEPPKPAIQGDINHASGTKHYEPTWESLAQHGAAPEWYEKAVFGIYFHWGVYSVPAYGGEKYYRSMYRPGHGVYEYHSKTYGDPLKFGYHDFIPMFKAEKWDPNRWAQLFENAGADFAGSIAEHGDGFAMWDTKYDEYNAKDMGPHRDIVGEMVQALRNRGMKVVTTFHNLKWDFYDHGRRLCPKGVGVNDPRLSGLYGPIHEPADPKSSTYGHIKRPKHPVEDPVPDAFREEGYNKLIEVIDKYRPDQLQIDGGTCARLGQDRLKKVLAHYFNSAQKWGKEVVVTRGYSGRHPYSKSEFWGKEVMISRVIPLSCSVQNVERHFPAVTPRTPFPDRQQATTPVPGFGYSYVASQAGKAPDEIEECVDALVDGIVDVKSKNGVTLLGVAPKPDGTFPDSQVRILSKLGDWMRVNKEAIHGSKCQTPCGAGCLRFTRKEPYLYVISLEEPSAPVTIPGVTPVKGSNIRMLGSDKNLAWRQVNGNVVIEELPAPLPCDHAWAFKLRAGDSTQKDKDENGNKALRSSFSSD